MLPDGSPIGMAPGGHVSIPRAFIKASVALALTSVPFLTTSAFGQSPAARGPTPDEPASRSTDRTAVRVPDSRHPLPHHRQTTIVIRDGIVIWETPEDAKVPFLLKFNVNTQLRYLNTLDSDETFTDHLGVARDVHTRNDITVNRAMFILGGYIFDKTAAI